MKYLGNRLLSLSAVFGLVACAALPAYADNSIYLEVGPGFGGTNPYQYGDGGEFTAVLDNGSGQELPVPNGYSSLVTRTIPGGYSGYSSPGGDGGGSVGDKPFVGQTGFETFCVEDDVNFYVGYSYSYSEGYAIQQTGGFLTAGTAWLYQQFATGQLAGYDYTNSTPSNTRIDDAGELQSTLWALQGEPTDPSVYPNPTPANNQFLNLVEEHFGGGNSPTDLSNGLILAKANITNASEDPYDVEVLELSNSSGIAQDQLIYNGPHHVPDTSATIGLLGASLLALVLIKRLVSVSA